MPSTASMRVRPISTCAPMRRRWTNGTNAAVATHLESSSATRTSAARSRPARAAGRWPVFTVPAVLVVAADVSPHALGRVEEPTTALNIIS